MSDGHIQELGINDDIIINENPCHLHPGNRGNNTISILVIHNSTVNVNNGHNIINGTINGSLAPNEVMSEIIHGVEKE